MMTLIIWDTPDTPPCHTGLVYRWDGYNETESVRSLLRYAELHAGKLRARYLAWIHDLGERRIKGRRIIDHLAFEDGLSYWWMTLFVEKSPYNSPISNAIRLFALEEIITGGNFNKVLMVGGNQILNDSISSLCENIGIRYEWQYVPVRKQKIDIRRIYKSLPDPVQAIISLVRHLAAHWPLRRQVKAEWFDGRQSVLLCSYFIHLDADSCPHGRFHSQQWEAFPKLLKESGLHTNWIQHYLRSDTAPKAGVAVDMVNRFNLDLLEQGCHIFLDTYLSWRSVRRSLARWWKMLLVTFRLGGMKMAFQPNDSHISLWPLMKDDWYDSMRGPQCMRNMLWIELFDAAIREVPRQKLGFYLCENQPWERAFIHAWRKHGHGRLVAVAHSTVRFWDLRYFTDPRTFEAGLRYPVPIPDVTALNGQAAIDAFDKAGQPMDRTVESEALRYMHLRDASRDMATGGERRKETRVLVLGDYTRESTNNMLRLLDSSVNFLPDTFKYTVKPHPSFMVNAEEFPKLNLKIVTEPLAKIMGNFDIAYASNKTAAAVDAYIAGLPVVIMLDGAELNYSPLRGHKGVGFVSTPKELSDVLQAQHHDPPKSMFNKEAREFFFLDPEMPRWKQIIQDTNITDRETIKR